MIELDLPPFNVYPDEQSLYHFVYGFYIVDDVHIEFNPYDHYDSEVLDSWVEDLKRSSSNKIWIFSNLIGHGASPINPLPENDGYELIIVVSTLPIDLNDIETVPTHFRYDGRDYAPYGEVDPDRGLWIVGFDTVKMIPDYGDDIIYTDLYEVYDSENGIWIPSTSDGGPIEDPDMVQRIINNPHLFTKIRINLEADEEETQDGNISFTVTNNGPNDSPRTKVQFDGLNLLEINDMTFSKGEWDDGEWIIGTLEASESVDISIDVTNTKDTYVRVVCVATGRNPDFNKQNNRHEFIIEAQEPEPPEPTRMSDLWVKEREGGSSCEFNPSFGENFDQSITFGINTGDYQYPGLPATILYSDGAWSEMLNVEDVGSYSTEAPEVIGSMAFIAEDMGDGEYFLQIAFDPGLGDIQNISSQVNFDGDMVEFDMGNERGVSAIVPISTFERMKNNSLCISITAEPPVISDLAVFVDEEEALTNSTLNMTVINNGPDDSTGTRVLVIASTGQSHGLGYGELSPGSDGYVNVIQFYNRTELTWMIGLLQSGQQASMSIPFERVTWREVEFIANVSGDNIDNVPDNNQVVINLPELGFDPMVVEVTGPGEFRVSGSKPTSSNPDWRIDYPDGTSYVRSSTGQYWNDWEVPEGTHEILITNAYNVRLSSVGVNENVKLNIVDFGNVPTKMVELSNVVLSSIPELLPSHITDMSSAFGNGMTFEPNSIESINGWNTSNITNMNSTFRRCDARALDLSGWDVSKVTDMNNMFYDGGSEGTEVGYPNGISNWDTSSVTNMSYMFAGSQVVSSTDPLNDVPDVSGWDVSSVQDFSYMFAYNNKMHSQDLSGWNTSSATDIRGMFNRTVNFNGNITTWDTSNVTNMSIMFGQTEFNQDISGWDTSKVTSFAQMFMNNTEFNQDISGWDVGAATNMTFMFYYASAFNQDLSGWCVSNIATKPNNFDTNTPEWVKTDRQPVWGTCP